MHISVVLTLKILLSSLLKVLFKSNVYIREEQIESCRKRNKAILLTHNGHIYSTQI